MIESYFRNGHTFHIFRESYRSRPKVRTQENIDTVQRQMEEERQLSLGQLLQQTELTVSTCQRIVRKDLEDSVTAERYWNNILDVFINQLQLAQGYFQQDGATARETSLFVVIF
jgi:AraC-like DNA-binding protein